MQAQGSRDLPPVRRIGCIDGNDCRLVCHSIANDAAHQILSRGALIGIQQEFLLIEQICFVVHKCVKADAVFAVVEQITEFSCQSSTVLFALCGHKFSSVSRIS